MNADPDVLRGLADRLDFATAEWPENQTVWVSFLASEWRQILAALRASQDGAAAMRERCAQTAITAVAIMDNSACSLAMERALDIAGKKIRALPLTQPATRTEGGGDA